MNNSFMEKRTKKGELEMEHIIIAIILIIGFIALAYFLVRLDIGGVGEDAACKLSILAKATAPNWLPGVPPSIPIECVTKKICLGGECLGNFDGEKNVEKKKLSKDKNESMRLIEKTVADEFYNCWDDYGRGKMDIFGSLSESVLASEKARPRCVICSRIALDKNNPTDVANDFNIREYMSNNKPTGSDFNYFKTLELGSSPKLIPRTSETSLLGISKDNARKADEVAVVFMQISAPAKYTAGNNVVNLGFTAGFLGSSLITGSGFKTLKILVTNPAARLATVIIAEVGYTITEWSAGFNRVDAAAYCGDYGNKGSIGCSVIQIMPYDRSSINSLCEIVEGEA